MNDRFTLLRLFPQEAAPARADDSGSSSNTRPPMLPRAALLAVALALLQSHAAFAANTTTTIWNGTGSSTSPNWSQSSNWSNGVPSSSLVAEFNTAASTWTKGNPGYGSTSVNADGLWITGSTATSFSIDGSSGSMLTLGGNGTINGIASVAILVDTTNTGQAFDLGGNGTVKISNSTSFLDDSSDHFYIGQNVTLDLNSKTLTLGGSGSGNIDIYAATAASGSIIVNESGTGIVTLYGGGATDAGGNLYTGTTTITQGTLAAGTIVVSGGASDLGNASSAVVLGGASTAGTLKYTGLAATYTRGFTVNAGGGGLTNSTANLLQMATGDTTVASGGTFTLDAASSGGITLQSSSIISGAGGVAVNSPGSGTVTFNGAMSYTGATNVSNGTLTYSGSASSSGNGDLTVAGSSGNNAILNFNSSGTLSFTGSSGVIGGTLAAGAINQTNGSLTLDFNSGTGTNYVELGYGSGAYGSYNLSGGTLTTSGGTGAGIRVGDGGLGVFTQTGGALNLTRYFVVGTSGGTAVATFTGGTATMTNAGFEFYVSSGGGTGVMNIGTEASGTAVITSNSGAGFEITTGSTSSGTLNLNRGMLVLNAGSLTNGGNSPNSFVNFNGGTLQAGAAGLTLIAANDLTSVNIYKGGAVFDTNGNTATVAANLLATAGNGIYKSAAFTATAGTLAGAGYIGAPLVAVSGGSGTGAQAIANINTSTGLITGFTLTNPGQNYVAGNVLTFTLSGGGASTAASPYTYTVLAGDLAANTGGVTVNDSSAGNTGVLILSGANTYTGITTLNAGTLQVDHAESAGVSGPLGNSVAANPGSIVFAGGTLQYSSVNNNDYSGRFSTAPNQAINIDTNGRSVTFATALTSSGGSLTLNDTNATTGTLTLSAAETYTGATTVTGGTLTFTGASSYSGSGALGIAGAAGSATLNVNTSGTLSFVNGAGSAVPVNVGSVSGASGAINQTAGTVNLDMGGSYLQLGAASGAYGSYNLSGGTLNTTASSGIRVGDGGSGTFTQSGGTLTDSRYFSIGEGTGTGVATFTGGTATVLANAAFRWLIGDQATGVGVLNLGTEAGGTATITSNSSAGFDVTDASTTSGTLNLNRGMLALTAGTITNPNGSANSFVNFNGGTLQAAATGLTLLDNSPTSVKIYKGGAVFDTDGNAATVSANLLAVAGNGVYPTSGGTGTLAIASGGGTGYIGAPLVTVTTNGSGTGATAIANISAAGVVTGVTLTNPGTGYATGNTLTFAFSGGGDTTAASNFVHTLVAGDLASNTGGVTVNDSSGSGSGVLTLSGTGTNYTGATTINAGTLILQNTTAFASPVTVKAGTTLELNPSGGTVKIASAAATVSLSGALTYATSGGTGAYWQEYFGLVTANATSTIDVTATGGAGGNSGLYLDGGLAGSANVTVTSHTNGVGLILRNSVNGYSGAMTVNGNTSTTAGAGSGLALGTTGTTLQNADLTINGTLELGDSASGMGWALDVSPGTSVSGSTVSIDSLAGSGDVVANMKLASSTRTLSVGNNGGGGIFSGIIADGANDLLSFTKAGAGTQTLSGANTYSGGTTVSAGTLTISSAGSLVSPGALAVSGSGAVANINGTYTNTSGAGKVTVDTGGTLNMNGTITLGGASTGDILIGGSLSTGTLNITGGTVTVNYTDGHGFGIGNLGAGTLAVSGGTLNVLNGTINDVFYVGFASSSGNGTFTVSGSGIVNMGADNVTFGHTGSSGTVNLNGGTLQAGGFAELTTTGAYTIHFNGGALQAGQSNTSFLAPLTGLTANVDSGGAIIDTQAFNVTIGQPLINGTGSPTDGGLTKLGSGTLVVTGANTYNGGTTVSAGTLQVAGTLGATTGAVNVAGAATLYLGGTSQTTGAVTLSGGNLTSGMLNGASYAVSGGNISTVLTGNGALNKTTGGTLRVSGASTYSGGTSLNGGVIVVGASGTAGSNPAAGYKIVAAGDSITFGSGTTNPATQAWPAVLQTLLGGGFTVLNEGHSGATAITDGSIPYNTTAEYTAGLAANPNAVVIQLGTNDTNTSNGNFAKATANSDFVNSLTALVNAYKATANHPVIFLALPPAIYTSAPSDNETNLNVLLPLIQQVATATGATVIDNNTVLQNESTLYGDGLHPNNQGAAMIGQNVYGSLAATYYNNGPLGTGTITMSSGTLSDDGSARTLTNSLAITGSVTFASTGSGSLTFDPTGLATPSTTTISNSPTLTVTNTTTIKEAVSGTGFTKAGGGTLVLAAANTYAGVTTLKAGTINLGSAESAGVSGPLGQSAANNPGSIVLGGGFLQYSSVNQNDYSGRFSTAANQAYNVDTHGQSVAWGTALTSSGGTLLLKDSLGTGTLTLSGANSYAGGTTVSAGTLRLSGSGTFGNGGLLTVSGGKVDLNGASLTAAGNSTVNGISDGGSSSGTITSSSGTPTLTDNITDGSTRTYGGKLSGSLALTIANSSSGVQVLSGNNSYTGPTTVASGELQLGSNTALTTAGTALTLGGSGTSGVLDLNGFTATVSSLSTGGGPSDAANQTIYSDTGDSNPSDPGGTLLFNGAGFPASTYGGVLTDNAVVSGFSIQMAALNLTVAGGTLTLTNTNNSISGTTTISAGTLAVTSVAALGGGTTTILLGGTLTTGTFQYAGTGETLSRDFTLNGGGAISNTGGGTLTLSGGTITKTNQVLTFTGGGAFVVGDQITGGDGGSFNSDLVVNGGATVTLTNSNNNYTGPTYVYGGGTLINGVASAVPSGTVLTLGNSGDGAVTNTYDLGGFDTTIAALNSVGSSGPNANVVTNSGASGGNTLTLSGINSDSVAVNSTFGGTIGDGAHATTALTIGNGTSTPTVTLTGANTYSGPTTVSSGTLVVGINNAIPGNSAVTIGGSSPGTGTLNLQTYSNTIGSLSFGAGGGTLRIAANSTSSPQLVTSGALTLGANTHLNLSGMSTAAGLYELIGATSLSGTFATVTGLDSNYALVYGTVNANEIDAQHKATISLSASAAANAFVNATVSLTDGTLSNGAPSGSANLAYGVATDGSKTLTLTDTTSPTSAVAVGAPRTITGTIATGSVAGTQTWGLIETDANASNSPVAVGGAIQVYNHGVGSVSAGTLTFAAIVGYGTPPTSTNSVTLSNTQTNSAAIDFAANSDSFASIGAQNAVANGSSRIVTGTLAGGLSSGSHSGNLSLGYGDASTISSYAGYNASLGTVSVPYSVTVYDHAIPDLTSGTLTLGNIHAGYLSTVTSTNSLTVNNAAGTRVALAGSATAASGISLTPLSGIAAGNNGSISASLATGQGVGAINQVFTYTFADDSSLAGASNNVGPASITVTGQVYSGQGVWNSSASGNWGDFSKWTANGGAPGLAAGFLTGSDTATFDNTAGLSGQVAVTLNGVNPSLSAVTFNESADSYTIQSAASEVLKLNNTLNSAAATLTDTAGNHTISSGVQLSSDVAISVARATDTLTLSGNISESGGSRALSLSGLGTLVLSGTNSYSGTTTINGGVLVAKVVSGSSPLGGGGSVSVANGGELDLSGDFNSGPLSSTITSLAGTGAGVSGAALYNAAGGTGYGLGAVNLFQNPGTITLDSGGAAIGAASGTYFRINGKISGGSAGAGLTIAGAGTVIVANGTNNYTGGTVVNTGATLAIGSSTAVPNGALIVNGTFDLNGFNQTVSSLSGTGQIGDSWINGSISTPTLTFAGGASRFGGSIIDHFSFGDQGHTTSLTVSNGSLTLSGINTYSGATNINGGTLNLTGSLGNTAVGVSGGTLTGAGGTISGGVTLNSGAIDFTKNGLSTTTTLGASSLALNGGSLTFNLNGSGTDLINLGGGGALSGSGPTVVNINGLPDAATSGTYNLIDYGSETGLIVGVNLTLGSTPGRFATNYALHLTSTGSGELQLLITSVATPHVAYWTGGQTPTGPSGSYNWGDNNGTNTNWSSSQTSVVDTLQFPGPTTDVVFAEKDATSGSLSTHLETAYAINSLTVLGSNSATTGTAVIIGGSGSASLTINAANNPSGLGYTAGTGIVIQSGAAGLTINTAGGVIAAASQAWTNNSSHSFQVSSNVNGSSVDSTPVTLTLSNTDVGGTTLSGNIGNGTGASSPLTLVVNNPGSGVTLLSGANSYSGGTTVSGGTLLANAAATSSSSSTGLGNVVVNAGGTLGGSGAVLPTTNSTSTVTVFGSGTIEQSSSGQTLTINGGLVLKSGSIGSFTLGSPSDPALINVTGLLTSADADGGVTTINITNSSLSGTAGITTYDLLSYGSGGPGAHAPGASITGFTLGATPTAPTGDVWQLETTTSQLDLVLVSAAAPQSYNGGPSVSGTPPFAGGTFYSAPVSTGGTYAGVSSTVTTQASGGDAAAHANGFGPLLQNTTEAPSQEFGSNSLGGTSLYADIRAGTNSGGSVTVDMSWRNRFLDETAKLEEGTPTVPPLQHTWSPLISNVLLLTGMATPGGPAATYNDGSTSDTPNSNYSTFALASPSVTEHQTDSFVLQMNYDAALLGNEHYQAGKGAIYLAWLAPAGLSSNGNLNLAHPEWLNAVAGNFDLTTPENGQDGATGTYAVANFQGSFDTFVADLEAGDNFGHGVDTLFQGFDTSVADLTTEQLNSILGSYGVDISQHAVWAVINHNSVFSVVPEPSSLLLAALGLLGMAGYQVRRRRK